MKIDCSFIRRIPTFPVRKNSPNAAPLKSAQPRPIAPDLTFLPKRGKEKVVVACGDFTEGGKRLIEFAHLKNTCISSEQNGYGKELSSIMQAIDEQMLLPPDQLRGFFWDMFIADALLGNFDRHNGNWGILVDEQSKTAEIAPVYDCGSCLYLQLAAKDMGNVLNSEDEM